LLAGVVVVALCVGFLGSAVWTLFRGIYTKLEGVVPVPRPGERINVLFLGLDAFVDESDRAHLDVPLRDSRSRSDTMILISLDPETHEAGLISIPRDTRAAIPGKWADKINAAHAYGGPLLAMKTVEGLLGIPVHYYVRTDYRGIEAVVDTLGGVEIDVEMDMYYVDPAQDLVIDLDKGLQRLDGDKALQYLRYRNGGGDIARIQRQQNFIKAVVRQATSFGTLLRAQALAREAIKYIDTNLTTGELLDFALLASRIDDPKIEMATLPGQAKYITDEGRPPLSYWVMDEDATEKIVDELVWGIDPEKNAWVRVQVLNGSVINGAAAEMAKRLEADGFDVVGVGNAENPAIGADTRIIVHTQDELAGRLVARSVFRYAAYAGLFRDTVKEPACDVTVVVGKDFSLAGVGP
jgi:LCP family protein required for cell wall assembly